ncbi:ABC transporter permease [Simiduia sp. 21SJ11W-1]|uniref:ABC transporter permease n=1 Tax=Simiduia sp. 21SJ11W-1 TaxID=2909669 RepID=UPI0020A07CEF|nr:ABC transporter permease [Simiduia sp. 21SJ11W-1]UTA49538.1 ABC transporter permease [Simiduia sp. 21SJ11W-1]
MIEIFRIALNDIGDGLRRKDVWVELAKEDIGDQHKKTLLGPLWLLVNYLLFACTFIYVFKMGGDIEGYTVHVAVGLLIWLYMSEVISQGVVLFGKEQSFIKGTRLPLTVYVLRLTTQSVIRAVYAFVGCIALLFVGGFAFTETWYISILGLILIIVSTPAVVYFFAFVGAFFPDVQFLVSNIMRIGMFLTPVFWVYDNAGGIRYLLYSWNPFTYYIELVRAPLMSASPDWLVLTKCIGMSVVFWLVAFLLLGTLKKRVAFVI